jgi:Carboxypeptidase regulatory-like domain
MKKIFFVFSLCFTFGLSAQQVSTLRLQVKDKSLQNPIEGASVTVLPENLTLLTNSKGEAIFENIPAGRHELSLSHLGYSKKIIKEILSASGKEI